MTELLPCPFCGRAPYYMDRASDVTKTKRFHAITCYCGGFVGNSHKHGETKEEATTRWNTRVYNEQDKTLVNALRLVEQQLVLGDLDLSDLANMLDTVKIALKDTYNE